MYKYQLYTLGFISDIPILGYQQLNKIPKVDYQLQLVTKIERPKAGMPNVQYKPWSIASPDFYYLDVEGIATFLVKSTGIIELYIYPESSQADALPFFHDTILSVALIYKNIFTLKASAVKRKATEEANLFCANNGGGKSTLAAVLTHNQYLFVEDDRVLLDWNESQDCFTVKNYHPKVELWNNVGRELVQNKDLENKIVQFSHPVRPGLLKSLYSIQTNIVTQPIKVSNCFLITLMNDDEPTSFTPIKGLQKARTLLHHLHQHQLIKPLGKFKEGFVFASKLIQQVDMLAVNRAENVPFTEFLHLIVREMGTDMSGVAAEIMEKLPQS